MRYLSMFSGIEAATVAWHPLGWQPAAFVEIEKFPSAILAHHYPNVPNLGDVTKADIDAIGPIDLAVFGSPCQSFSVAGKRLGLDDPRGNLALLAGTIVYRKRPTWFVFENVPGLLSSDSGWDFGTLLAAYAGYPPGSVFSPPCGGWKNSGIVKQAVGGYGLAWRVLDAQHIRVDGLGRAVPQRRRRVFVVGCAGGWQRAAAVLFERESLCGNSAPRRQTRQDLARSSQARAGDGGEGCDVAADRSSDGRGDDGARSALGVADTLSVGANQTTGFVGDAVAVSHPVTSKWSKGTGGPAGDECQNLVAFSSSGDGYWREGVGPLRARENDSHETLVAFDATHEVAGTMMSFAKSGGDSNRIDNADSGYMAIAKDKWAVRRLTPRECERLQGFPDGYTDVPWRNKNWTPDGPRYKALGNSMAVNVMRWIGTRIAMVDAAVKIDAA